MQILGREHESVHPGFERNNSGSFAIFAAIRRASFRQSLPRRA
jgi:hypothetical protein